MVVATKMIHPRDATLDALLSFFQCLLGGLRCRALAVAHYSQAGSCRQKILPLSGNLLLQCLLLLLLLEKASHTLNLETEVIVDVAVGVTMSE